MMEEAIQELHVANVIGQLYVELGWYDALAQHWHTSIAPKMLRVWQMLHDDE